MSNPAVALLLAGALTLLAAWLLWPDSGFFWRWRRARQTTRRVLIEDALKHLHDCEYHRRTPSLQSMAGALHITVNEASDLLADMQAHNLIAFHGDRPALTPQGRDYALHVVRAHRLWERYLADKTGYPESEWHSRSEEREHSLTPAQADALSGALGHPRFDPHGDPIPTADGELIAQERHPLPTFPLNTPGQIVHLEDEPETVYAQLVAEGLQPGMTVHTTESTPRRVRFWADGDEHVLAPIVAANISVAPLPEEDIAPPPAGEPLSRLKPGQTGRVTGLARACRGAERRRLLDLGILPGTLIKVEMVSPSGDPTAYRIRGALIALRKEQADYIYVTRTTA